MQTLKIGLALSQSWKSLKGSKWPIWLIYITVAAVAFGIAFVVGTVALGLVAATATHAGSDSVTTTMHTLFGFHHHDTQIFEQPKLIPSILKLVILVIVAPFLAGAVMIGVKRARGESVTFESGFQYFHRQLPLGCIFVLMNLFGMAMISVCAYAKGSNFFALTVSLCALIYLFIIPFFLMWTPAVADKKISIFSAWKNNFPVVLRNWFRLFLLFLSYVGIVLLLILTIIITSMLMGGIFGLLLHFIFPTVSVHHLIAAMLMVVIVIESVIALIWYRPYTDLLRGQVYHQLFDTENANPIV